MIECPWSMAQFVDLTTSIIDQKSSQRIILSSNSFNNTMKSCYFEAKQGPNSSFVVRDLRQQHLYPDLFHREQRSYWSLHIAHVWVSYSAMNIWCNSVCTSICSLNWPMGFEGCFPARRPLQHLPIWLPKWSKFLIYHFRRFKSSILWSLGCILEVF